MNRLLALTDLSTASEAVLRYAADLAGAYSLPLTVLYQPPAPPVPVPFTGPDDLLMPPFPLMDADAQPAAEDRLADCIARLRAEAPDLPLQGRVVFTGPDGMADDEDPAFQKGAHTVVVANDRAAVQERSWLDAGVADLLRSARRTVLAVPDGAAYQAPRAIGLALDPASEPSEAALAPLLDWVRLTGARLHVVRVVAGTEAVAEHPIPALASLSPQYHTLTDAGGIESGLLQSIRTLALDWLAVTPHSHGLFGGLFHKEHLQTLAKDCPVPLLALHAQA